MKYQLRITRTILAEMREDLARPHDFASERVGVVYCRFAPVPRNRLAILAHHYTPIPDHQYVDDPNYGAVIGSDAFRDIIQHLHDHAVGAFHVHMHPGRGVPRPSGDDLRETAEFVPDFFHGRRSVPHGAIILTADALSGRIWMGEHEVPQPISETRIVGAPMGRIGEPL